MVMRQLDETTRLRGRFFPILGDSRGFFEIMTLFLMILFMKDSLGFSGILGILRDSLDLIQDSSRRIQKPSKQKHQKTHQKERQQQQKFSEIHWRFLTPFCGFLEYSPSNIHRDSFPRRWFWDAQRFFAMRLLWLLCAASFFLSFSIFPLPKFFRDPSKILPRSFQDPWRSFLRNGSVPQLLIYFLLLLFSHDFSGMGDARRFFGIPFLNFSIIIISILVFLACVVVQVVSPFPFIHLRKKSIQDYWWLRRPFVNDSL